MTRKAIPKKTKEAVLDEYDHRCAVCGGDRPHIHHIDEDASNNAASNLLPLCPNCHLRDQHNPTRKVEISKLKLFREFKDPAILLPQFDPIYQRQLFLESVEVNEESDDDLNASSEELVEFVAAFEMGEFYSRRIRDLIEDEFVVFSIASLVDDAGYRTRVRDANRKYREKLVANRHAAQKLLVEQLRYQSWANA